MYSQFKNLSESFAYATECQIATLESMESKKSTRLHELQRQRSIVDGMIRECKAFKIEPIGTEWSSKTPRLKRLLETPTTESAANE